MTGMRIGHGYDVHAFSKEQGDHSITIGGVVIAHNRFLLAHSDGDVLVHALCDALLGAVALGDIGKHFPDTDPQYSGADSRTLLRQVMALVKTAGYELGNADMTIVAQAPKMLPHIPGMRDNLCEDMSCTPDQVNIKATTTEKLGFTGRGEGIACEAVVLLSRSN